MVLNDDMLDAAFRYRKAEVWKQIYSDDIFAVKLSNGEIGYCSVMGNNGEHFALGLYLGDEGLKTFVCSLGGEGLSRIELLEHSLMFDCITCDFMNAKDIRPEVKSVIKDYAARKGVKIQRPHGWPDFTRHQPFFAPWCITDAGEGQLMVEALDAAIAFGSFVESGKLSFPYPAGSTTPTLSDWKKGGVRVPLLVPDGNGGYSLSETVSPAVSDDLYKEFPFENDIIAGKVKSLPSADVTLLCRWSYMPVPFYSDDDDEAPVYQPILMVIDSENHDMNPVMPDVDSISASQLLCTFANGFTKTYGGRPVEIVVDTPLSYSFLHDFCERCGIRLTVRDERLDELDQVSNLMLSTMHMFF